jgi:hypothetical protein
LSIKKKEDIMRVKDLIKELKKIDPEARIIIQKDGEGNGYSPLAGIDYDVVYVPTSSYSGEIYDLEWSAEMAGMDDDEWESLKKTAQHVLFFPMN